MPREKYQTIWVNLYWKETCQRAAWKTVFLKTSKQLMKKFFGGVQYKSEIFSVSPKKISYIYHCSTLSWNFRIATFKNIWECPLTEQFPWKKENENYWSKTYNKDIHKISSIPFILPTIRFTLGIQRLFWKRAAVKCRSNVRKTQEKTFGNKFIWRKVLEYNI